MAKRSRLGESCIGFAKKLGVEEKLSEWGDDEIAGLDVESAIKLDISPAKAARLVSYTRNQVEEGRERQQLNRLLWTAARNGFKIERGLLFGGHRTSLLPEVDMLIRQGADIDSADMLGDTALHAAADGGHRDIVARLLQAGASVKVLNKAGKPPAVQKLHPLHAVVGSGPEQVAHELLELKGLDVNDQDETGQTALHLAARAGRDEIAKALIDKGARIDTHDKRGRTPLHWAASEGHTKCTKLLLSKDADVHARTEAGTTPLHWVACIGCLDTARLLLEAGADVNARNNDGYTPLDRATKDAMKALLTEAGGKGSLGWWSLRS